MLSRGGFCRKDRRQAEGLLVLHREMEVGYCLRAKRSKEKNDVIHSLCSDKQLSL